MEQDTKQFKSNKKNEILGRAVISGTPETINKVYKTFGKVDFTADLLMYACRYKGLSYVKALVENGASFNMNYRFKNRFQEELKNVNLSACILEFGEQVQNLMVGLKFPQTYNDDDTPLTLLPFEERAEILRYLFEHKEQTEFDISDALYYSVLADDDKMYRELKKMGAVFSEKLINILTVTGEKSSSNEWSAFTWCFRTTEEKRLPEVLRRIIKEVGNEKKLCFDGVILTRMNTIMLVFYSPEFFSLLLEHFNQKQIKGKSAHIRNIIYIEAVSLLPIIEKHGWLKNPKTRDEMIEFAVENEKTECAAWLLDYKNRTADLAKENKMREQKQERELNQPNYSKRQ